MSKLQTNTIIQGDAKTELQKLPAESINCCISSPPYWALRDYGVAGQLGLEPTFEEYIQKLCDIYDEVKRVLRKDGCVFVNLGDTYSGSGGAHKNDVNPGISKSYFRGGAVRGASCGTSDTKLGDFLNYDYLFENLCGACLTAYLIGKFHNDNPLSPKQYVSPFWPNQEHREVENCHYSNSDCSQQENHILTASLGLEQTSSPANEQLLSFLESKHPSSSGGFSLNVSNHSPAEKCLCCGRSFSSDVLPSERKAGNKKHILSLLSSLVFHKNNNHNACPYPHYNKSSQNVKEKSLCLIPQRFAIAMVERGWLLRNVIIWAKPNPMPSSAKDRFTVDFEYVYFFTKNRKYFFEPQYEPQIDPFAKYPRPNTNPKWDKAGLGNRSGPTRELLLGRNKRTVWTIPTEACPEAHFATFPRKLVEPMIRAGCPEFICTKCGKAREKIYDVDRIQTRPIPEIKRQDDLGKCATDPGRHCSTHHFKGYTDCGCNAGWRPGVCLDMFRRNGNGRLCRGQFAQRLCLN